MQVSLEEPEREERTVHRLFAQIEDEFFEGHGLVVHGDDEVA
jgi:hypothetical protein